MIRDQTTAPRDPYPYVWIRPGSSDRALRSVYDTAPTITAVEIERSDRAEVPIATFPTLTAAEDAIRAAFVARPFGDWQDGVRIVVRVAWDDDAEQRATLEINAPTVRERAAFGLIKWHLMELGRTLLTANSVRARAWGAEVRHRLVQDRSNPRDVTADGGWRDSLRFLPTDDGAPPPAIASVVVAYGREYLPLPESPGGIRYASAAAADVAIAGFMKQSRADRQRDAVISVLVTWVDGMAFRFWFLANDQGLRPSMPDGFLFRAMEDRAEAMLADAYAEKNARALPRRPLEPQQAWARELLRRIGQSPSPVDAPRNARRPPSGAPPAIRSVAFTSCDVAPVRKIVVGHEFRTLAAADFALARALSEYPADAEGRVGFLVTWTDGATHEGIAPFTRADADGGRVGVTAVIRRHLRAYALTTTQAVKLAGLLGSAGLDLEARRAWGAELARRLDADDADRDLRNDDSAAPAAPVPAIREVAILWAEDNAIPLRAFPSLWEADAAIERALRGVEIPGLTYIKVGFVVSWSDGASYEGRVDVSAAALARAPSKGGVLRDHLGATARWLQGDEFRRLFGPHFPPDRIARDQAWGHELARRLDADRRHHDEPAAPRNRASAGAR